MESSPCHTSFAGCGSLERWLLRPLRFVLPCDLHKLAGETYREVNLSTSEQIPSLKNGI